MLNFLSLTLKYLKPLISNTKSTTPKKKFAHFMYFIPISVCEVFNFSEQIKHATFTAKPKTNTSHMLLSLPIVHKLTATVTSLSISRRHMAMLITTDQRIFRAQ